MDIRATGLRVCLPPDGRELFHIKEASFPSGSRTLIRGPSGKGKTTLLHLLAGLMDPTEGYIFVGEKNLRFFSDKERCFLRRTHYGIVFQKLNLLEHLTARENVLVANPDSSRADKALERLEISPLANTLAGNLSLGEQQRVAVARAFAQEPRIVLADEPTSSLDEVNARLVCEGLMSLPGKPTLIVVSHDSRLGDRFDRVVEFGELTR